MKTDRRDRRGGGREGGRKGKRRGEGEKPSIRNTNTKYTAKQYKKPHTVQLHFFVNFDEPSFRIRLPGNKNIPTTYQNAQCQSQPAHEVAPAAALPAALPPPATAFTSNPGARLLGEAPARRLCAAGMAGTQRGAPRPPRRDPLGRGPRSRPAALRAGRGNPKERRISAETRQITGFEIKYILKLKKALYGQTQRGPCLRDRNRCPVPAG